MNGFGKSLTASLFISTESKSNESLTNGGNILSDEPKVAVQEPPGVIQVDITRQREPYVTCIEMVRFLIWSIVTILTQFCRDVMDLNWYRPILASDNLTHYFYIPVARKDPRLVLSAPCSRMKVKIIPSKTTRLYEELGDLSGFPEKEILNFASNNYGGFCFLDAGSRRVLETALQLHPFAPAPSHLQKTLELECAAFMGFDAAATRPSGFSTNITAFSTVAAVATSLGKSCVFFCDSDCHNSMFTGAFMCGTAKVQKFQHDDLTDLEYKLRKYREQAPDALICVAIEGIYSMEGSISPGPAIIALKRVYGFSLLVDEAHSFMALGSNGRGSFNHWQDLGYNCPLDEVDVMSCMFSKSIGCTGGVVLANGVFANELRKGGIALAKCGVEPLSTIVVLRVLDIIRRPVLIQHRMRLLRDKASYVSKKLAESGCKILSSPGSAIICFPVGTVRQVMEFHGEAMNLGVAIVGGVPPATPLWGCRIRICVFATTAWQDIYRMVRIVNLISLKLAIPGIRIIKPDSKMIGLEDTIMPDVEEESNRVCSQMLKDVDSRGNVQATNSVLTRAEEVDVKSAGIEALAKYGVGPCSARWFYGSFDVFVDLEKKLATLYPSLVQQAGRTRGMICGDAEITIGSTLTALMGPSAYPYITHVIMVPRNAPDSILQAAELPRPRRNVVIYRYKSVHDIRHIAKGFPPHRLHVTIYLATVEDGKVLDLAALVDSITDYRDVVKRISNFTVMLDDRHGMGKIGPKRLGYLDLVESVSGPSFLKECLDRVSRKASLVIAGSWYDAFGHQGGYVIGPAPVIESLTWTVKASFFSTPPMPLQAAMSLRTLEILEAKHVELSA